MPTLSEKVQALKLNAYLAARMARFWEETIAQHGEYKAEQFYRHRGHNHIERKGIEWEGLTLSRQPTEAEKIAVKGVAQTQESSREKVATVLNDLRVMLTTDGLKQIESLSPADYHTLLLRAPKESSSELREKLTTIYSRGRQLVANELGKKDALPDYDDDELDTLTDLGASRVANDVQARITAAAAKYRGLGLEGEELMAAITSEITAGSISYIDRTSVGLANRVISMGRSYEAQRRSDEWERVEYSALLDSNVCDPCASEDGKTAGNENDLQPTPNPECAGSDYCRCFHVYINQ